MTHIPKQPQSVGADNSANIMVERPLTLSDIAREIARSNSRPRAKPRFQLCAFMLYLAFFAHAVFEGARYLLVFFPPGVLLLALVAAGTLFPLALNNLIQGRGDESKRMRKTIYKVHVVSMPIISLSFVLMNILTFDKGFARVLDDDRQVQHVAIEQPVQCKAELESVHDALARAQQAARRADELRGKLAELKISQDRARKSYNIELDGNTTANPRRVKRADKRARGFKAEATQLRKEKDVATQDIDQLGNIADRLTEPRNSCPRSERVSTKKPMPQSEGPPASWKRSLSCWTPD